MNENAAEEVTAEEVRPGLERTVRRTRQPDGRYLLYFDFSRLGQRTGEKPEAGTAGAGREEP